MTISFSPLFDYEHHPCHTDGCRELAAVNIRYTAWDEARGFEEIYWRRLCEPCAMGWLRELAATREIPTASSSAAGPEF